MMKWIQRIHIVNPSSIGTEVQLIDRTHLNSQEYEV